MKKLTIERGEEQDAIGLIVETSFHKMPNPIRLTRWVDDDTGAYFVGVERDGTDWHINRADVITQLGTNWDALPVL